MKIKRFEIPGLAQYSYMISSQGKAAVIDPMRDVDRYVEYAAREGLTIVQVLETHIHADFAAGSLALAEESEADLALSGHDEGQHYEYRMPHRPLRDGESIQVGNVRLQALHTPGHTPEHLSFVLYDEERSKTEPVAVFSGDFLFVGSLGRPDLLGEEAKVSLAHDLFRSLHGKIAFLPDGVQLYPGHGAGSLCGAGMSDRPESTLGYERATNVLFQLSEDAFVTEVLASVPPMPDYYLRMKKLNSAGATRLSELPGRHALTADDVKILCLSPDVVVLDLRRPEAFGGAHIPRAINIGAGQNLSLWSGWILDSKSRIILVNDVGDDEDSRRSLVRVGLDGIEGFLDKGISSWIDAGMDLARTKHLSVCEVDNSFSTARVVDVRSDKEWADGHIAGAQHLMLGDLPRLLQTLPEDLPLIAVCGSGYRSSIAASLLARSNRTNVSSMDGGMAAWQRRSLTLTREG